MRISILAGGFGGSVGDMQTDLSRLHSNIEATISDLRSLNRKLDNVNGGTYNLGSAISGINRRIRTEETKLTNLEVTSGKINTFLDNAIETDASVARKVRQNQKEFFKDFPWLRPDNTNTEPSIWEQLAAAWSDFWGDVGDWISDLVSGIVDYLKEHAVELIIGLVAIVIGALLTWLTGGAFLAALAALLKATLIQAAIGAVISGVISWFTGGDFWDAFGDGFAQGFMWGGVFSAISSAITAIRSVIQGLNYADDVANVANVADDVANVADDAANVTDDVANVADDAANVTDDVANVADDATNVTDDAANVADDAAGAAKEYPKYSKEVLDELTDIDNFDDEAIEHLFSGQAKKHGPSGLHYEGVDDVAGHIVDGTRTPVDRFGVYQAQISVDGAAGTKMSSFFPRDWSPQQVINNINQAFSKLHPPPGATGLFTSYTDDGMEIAIYLKNGKIHTAYPKWQGT